MAVTPLPGVGGTLFAGGGGMAANNTQTPFEAPGGIKTPSMGKNSAQQNLHSPHSGLRSTITNGDPLSRLMGQYGKGHSFAGGTGTTTGLRQIRGGQGIMRRVRGGLGPGKVGQAGPSSNYSMTSPDSE